MIRARVGSKWGSDGEAVWRGHCISGFAGADLMHVHMYMRAAWGSGDAARVVSKHSDETRRGPREILLRPNWEFFWVSEAF